MSRNNTEAVFLGGSLDGVHLLIMSPVPPPVWRNEYRTSPLPRYVGPHSQKTTSAVDEYHLYKQMDENLYAYKYVKTTEVTATTQIGGAS